MVLLQEIRVVEDQTAVLTGLFEEVFEGTFVFVDVEVNVPDSLHFGHLSDIVHHIEVGVAPGVEFLVEVGVGVFVLILKQNWPRELDEEVNDDDLADALRGEHGDARDVEDVGVHGAWILEGVNGDKLTSDHEEGVDEQRGHMEAHGFLVDHQALVFVELLFEASQSICQE